MDWLILLGSGALEAVWATALGRSDGFKKPLPTVVFLLAAPLSLLGLGWALTTIPTGTAYAVWTSVGAGLTVAVAWLTGREPASIARATCLVGIVACVVGLKAIA